MHYDTVTYSLNISRCTGAQLHFVVGQMLLNIEAAAATLSALPRRCSFSSPWRSSAGDVVILVIMNDPSSDLQYPNIPVSVHCGGVQLCTRSCFSYNNERSYVRSVLLILSVNATPLVC